MSQPTRTQRLLLAAHPSGALVARIRRERRPKWRTVTVDITADASGVESAFRRAQFAVEARRAKLDMEQAVARLADLFDVPRDMMPRPDALAELSALRATEAKANDAWVRRMIRGSLT